MTQVAWDGFQEFTFNDHPGDPDAGAPWTTL